KHLAHDDLDVLVVDRHTLAAVDLLDLVHQVLLRTTDTQDPEDLLGVRRTEGGQDADLDVVPVRNTQTRTLRDRVLDRVGAVVGGHDDLARLVRVLDLDTTSSLRDRSHALRGTGLEELDHTGKTLRDVVRGGHTTGVEGTHGQLRAGLTDRLGRDDADGLTDVDQLAGGQRAAVALRAGTGLGVTGQHGADLDLLDTGGDELTDLDVTEVLAGGGEGLAGLRVGD